MTGDVRGATGAMAPAEKLIERTLPGVHDALYAIFRSRVEPPGPVLDLGAGSGAWADRLTRQGYQVTAAERDVGVFAVPGVRCLPLDLNHRFSESLGASRFRAITSVEVI